MASTVSTALYTVDDAELKFSGSRGSGGRERIKVIPYVTTAIATGSTINVCKLVAGSIVTGIQAHVEGNAGSSTLKVTVGTTDVVAATSIATTDVILYANLQALDGLPLTAETTITAVTGGATLTAGKEIVFIVRYVLD